MKDEIYCTHCGAIIDTDDYSLVNGRIVCTDCVDRYCTVCDRCGSTIFDSDSHGDEYTNLCSYCYENYYTHCYSCDNLIHNDDSYEYDGEYYCSECHEDVISQNSSIHDYNYKPDPIFYGDNNRYFGVELEIDGAGKYSENADELLYIGNRDDECIYIKSDGSLNDGMEIVTHPMTLEYHKQYQWKEIMRKSVSLGYRSHQTSTCGLHIHVNRDSLGESVTAQDEVISRILYFVEQYWNEMLKFSRRSKVTMNRWAARYGYESTPKAILDKAKKNCCGRYAAVNLCNHHTIEFRMFRGTLKHNTMIAALQLVNEICNAAFSMSDDEIQKLSWSDFVAQLEDKELIHYLKQRNLYINEPINTEEEM